MLCKKCEKREATIKIDGYYLCKNCAINEIINKVRKLINVSRILEKKEEIVIPSLYFNENISNILYNIVNRIVSKRNIRVKLVKTLERNHDNINISDILWNYLMELKKNYENNDKVAIFTPFTSDFFLVYFLYSSLTGDKSYLPLISLIYSYGSRVTLFQPFISIPSFYLSVFRNWEIEPTGDTLFDELFNWGVKNLSENSELFHTFTKSLDLYITRNRCNICGASIPENVTVCSRCSKILASPFRP